MTLRTLIAVVAVSCVGLATLTTRAGAMEPLEQLKHLNAVVGATKATIRCEFELNEKVALAHLTGVDLDGDTEAEKSLNLLKFFVFQGSGSSDKNPAFCAFALKSFGRTGTWVPGLLTGSGIPKPD